MAGRSRTGPALVRAASGAHPRGRDDAAGRLLQLEQIASGYSVARALPHRADARSAGRDQRPGRAAASRRGLSDPVDHPFGQGPGMEERLRAQRRRRLHPDRPRRRHQGGHRGGAPAALRGDDAGQGQPASGHCRSASSSMARRRAATGTSMPRAHASSRPRSFPPSNRRRGRASRPRTIRAASRRCASTSARACAACGNRPQLPLCRQPKTAPCVDPRSGGARRWTLWRRQ